MDGFFRSPIYGLSGWPEPYIYRFCCSARIVGLLIKHRYGGDSFSTVQPPFVSPKSLSHKWEKKKSAPYIWGCSFCKNRTVERVFHTLEGLSTVLGHLSTPFVEILKNGQFRISHIWGRLYPFRVKIALFSRAGMRNFHPRASYKPYWAVISSSFSSSASRK